MIAVWLLAAETSSIEGTLLRNILAGGPTGLMLAMLIFQWKIMLISEHKAALATAERERVEAKAERDRERARHEAELGAVRADLAEATTVYTEQVIPALVRNLDAQKELLELRQAEARRRDGR